ncbi:hypothetical protein E4U11_006991 [Claviceps purpurea]|nr:hypothetical protein E4U11_006991 [Claviceps purpurea]
MSSSRALDASTPVSTMRDLVESGRQARENAIKKHERALKLLTKVMNNCPCARGVERRRCTCKNFEKVAAEGGSIFKEAMYTCHCDVGGIFGTCDNVDHIQALHVQSTIFEALGKLDHAVKSAEWILELAPRLPDGYIRLGNLARLQKNEEYACELYAAGVEANKESAANLSPKSQHPYILYRDVLRQDPLRLPAEIVSQIFSYLSWIEIILVLRVSKEWIRKLTSPVHRQLWRTLVFSNEYHRPMLRPSHLQKVLSWAGEGGARRIVIEEGGVVTESTVTQLLESSPSLEHLVFHNIWEQTLPAHQSKWTQLKHISLSSLGDDFNHVEVDREGGFPQTFLQNAASSLEHLNLKGIPLSWYRGKAPHLPQLKTLRMGGAFDDNGPFPIFDLSISFPRLEQLCIGPDIPYLSGKLAAIRQRRWEDVWPHLKVLKFETCKVEIESSDSLDTRLSLRYLTALHSIQHVSLTLDEVPWQSMFREKYEHVICDTDVSQYSDFKNLRSFEAPELPITPTGGRILLSNAVMANQLTSFDLVFPSRYCEGRIVLDDPLTGTTIIDDPGSGTVEERSIWHLKGYEWLRGTPSIHTLGIYGFRFPIDAENNEGSPLPQFLATFPNLRTLKINSWRCKTPDFVSLVISIMRVTHLKTIYTYSVDGEDWDQLEETAQEHDVQLMWWQFPEQQWPMPLES